MGDKAGSLNHEIPTEFHGHSSPHYKYNAEKKGNIPDRVFIIWVLPVSPQDGIHEKYHKDDEHDDTICP